MADDRGGIAIVGMAALFPGAPDLDAFRDNLRRGIDAIGPVPAHRIDPVFLDPTVDALDRFYGDRGGFVDPWARFDPLRHGVVPSAVGAAEPDQLLLLRLAVDAVQDAGRGVPDLPRERTGVFIGRGGYITPGLARSAQKVREGEQILAVLRQVLPDLPEDDLARVKEAWREAAGDLAPDQAIGLVPNLAASRTANRLDLQGPAFTFDAACASSLVAVEHAVRELRAGRLDAALVGGVHLVHDPTFWSIFCRLGAMSRAGSIRPFDAEADGLLVGEGAGMVLLKRLSDAQRDGDRVRAVIRGVGSSSDGRGATLMSPSVRGQVLALQRAWQDAGLDPSTVGLVEAHGTATAAGDAAELATLGQVFGRDGDPVAVGSVKSMIGHTMPAAGIAGLIKATLAVEEGVWLPSLHVQAPHPLLAGELSGRFVVPGETSPWPSRGVPRRAGVNAFGFGGINAHLVLEEAPKARVRPGLSAPVTPVALYAAETSEGLVAAIEGDRRGRSGGPWRLALRDPSPERRAQAVTVVQRGRAWQGRKGMWFRPADPDPGEVALLFPGVEDAFDEGVVALADRLGLDLPDVLARPAAGLDDLGLRGAQIVASGRVTAAALASVGLSVDVVTGHSVGEWTALVVAGRIPEAEIDGFVQSLSDQTLALPDVVFGVLGTGIEAVQPVLARHPEVVVSHDNGPHQVIVCGPEDRVKATLAEVGGFHTILPFQSGFHTRHFAPFVDRMAPHIARVPLGPAKVAAWSSCDVTPYPEDDEGVRDLLRRHLVQAVRFRETIEALHARGVRTFVQVGAGSLAGFVDDVLGGRAHTCVPTSSRRLGGLDGFAFAVASLWCEGIDVAVDAVPGLRGAGGSLLSLGAPLLSMEAPPLVEVGGRPSVEVPPLPGRLGTAFEATLRAVQDAQAEVAQALVAPGRGRLGPRRATTRRRLSVQTDPYLLDHSLFAQPVHVDDPLVRYPVVPMTMNVQLMMDAAAALVPERVVVAVEDVRAWRWLVVAPPVEITIEAEFDGEDRVQVRIPGFAEATVVVASDWPAAPSPTTRALKDAQPLQVPMAEVYPERWMFHGPAYQGLADLGPTGSDGIHGAIVAREAPGATLDNVGQVFGFWGFERLPVDGLGFPSRIGRLSMYGPMPSPGARLEVVAWIDGVAPQSYRGGMEIRHRGQVWARIDGWENRRFETDDVVFPFLRKPGVCGLAEPRGDGTFVVQERWRTAASRELLIRRYLDRDGLKAWEAVQPWDRRAWVLRHVTACDAVRAWLWADGHGPLFPIEVRLQEGERRVLSVQTPSARDLRVAVAMGDGMAVAAVAEGRDPAEPVAELAAEVAARRAAEAREDGQDAVA